jgi:predicted Zn-dependent peptidase
MELDLLKSALAPEERCLRIGTQYHVFGETNFLDAQLKRLRRITPYDVLESAKKHLPKENQVILNVYGD